ncbi:MAG TPA: MFS transporter [Polyangiaceae bacterium]|nr:MFS transporter [Polyangiaceae bacterium]
MDAETRRHRRRVWVVSWIAYATYYVGRKGLSVAKKSLERELSVTRSDLAAIDTGYLVAYAAGQFVHGLGSDRFGPRRLVGLGMLASALACAAFGAASSATPFFLAFTANGFAQATGWPGTTRAMADATTTEDRRRVMALWTTCYQFGGIFATVSSAYLLRFGWRSTFFVPAVALALVGALSFAFLPGAGAATDDRGRSAVDRDALGEARRAALRSPVLWCYGACYFAIKLIRYSLLFWLPYYLSDSLGYAEGSAGYLSTAFEVGGVVGVVGAGLATDRVRSVSRPVLSAVMMGLLSLSLLLYTVVAPLGPAANALGLALVGALLFGPDSILSGAAAQDAGGPLAAGAATGLVNAVGSVGAVLQGALNAWLSRAFGWHAVFVALIVLAFLGALALTPTFRRADAT